MSFNNLLLIASSFLTGAVTTLILKGVFENRKNGFNRGTTVHLFEKKQEKEYQGINQMTLNSLKNVEKETKTEPTVMEIMKYGYPSMNNIKVRNGHVSSYNREHKTANWSCEVITKETLKKGNESINRSKCQFKEDATEHGLFRVLNSDYRNSGYDRGHFVPAGDLKHDQDFMCDTFYLSNMAPQVGQGFNRDYWERFESHVRSLLTKVDKVFACTGPLYYPNVIENNKLYVRYEIIGSNQIHVPTHFYKTFLLELDGNVAGLETYVMPNQKIGENEPLEMFRWPLEKLEKASGNLFFNKFGKKYEFNKKKAYPRTVPTNRNY